MSKKFLKIYRCALLALSGMIFVLSSIVIYKNYYDRLPGTILLETQKEQVLNYKLPVKGTVYLINEEESLETSSTAVSEFDFNSMITMMASKPQNYMIKT